MRVIASSLADQLLGGHLDGDLQRRLGGALARARLQHPELAALDGEFEILHVAIVLLQPIRDIDEGGERLGHQLLQRRLVGAGRDAGGLGDVLRRADAGNDVLALCIHQELAVELLFAGRRIAGEGNAGRRRVAHIAEHHGLHVDRGAPALGDIVQLAVGDGAMVHPAGKDRADRAPELLLRLLRKRLAQFLLDLRLVERDHLLPFGGGEFGIELVAEAGLFVLEDFLEHLVVEPHDDVGIHLDEAAVAVIGKTRVARILRQRLHRHVVEAEIEHRIHHARHRSAGAGAHGHQKQLLRIAEAPAGQLADLVECSTHLGLECVRIRLAVGIIPVAGFGGDGEAGRHRQAEAAHLGEVCALAAKQIAIARAAFRRSIAECVDPLRHACSSRPQAGFSAPARAGRASDRVMRSETQPGRTVNSVSNRLEHFCSRLESPGGAQMWLINRAGGMSGSSRMHSAGGSRSIPDLPAIAKGIRT